MGVFFCPSCSWLIDHRPWPGRPSWGNFDLDLRKKVSWEVAKNVARYATLAVVGKYPTKKEEMTQALENAVLANDFTGAAVIGMEMATKAMQNSDYQMAIELLEVVSLCLQNAKMQLDKMAETLNISLPN